MLFYYIVVTLEYTHVLWGIQSRSHPSLPPKGEGTNSAPSGGDVRRTEGGIPTKHGHTRNAKSLLTKNVCSGIIHSTNERKTILEAVMMARRKKGLGERHKKILAFLKSHQRSKGFPPTIREIGEATDISSTSVVNYYLNQLEDMGKIERERKVSRGIQLAGFNPLGEMFKIPIAGRIVAGEPIPVPASDFSYFDAESSVDIARTLLPSRNDKDELFALEVDGDSMIDAMVNDGDIVVMKSTGGEAKNGEMVAVWLPERDETTLKYFYKEDNRYRLQPANPTMEAIYIEQDEALEIKGKVVMVIRQIDKTVI